MTPEQRAFLDKLIEDWKDGEDFLFEEKGNPAEQHLHVEEIAYRIAEYHRLFPWTDQELATTDDKPAAAL